MDEGTEAAIRHPLATLGGLAIFTTLLFGSGAMCSQCGFGTRVTSKRWARCKKCGERVARRPMEDVSTDIKKALAASPPAATDTKGR